MSGSRKGAEIEFAPQDRADAHAELASEFLWRVFEIEDAWISDESILWDFCQVLSEEQSVAKIREVYGVDVFDIAAERLWLILDRIAASRT